MDKTVKSVKNSLKFKAQPKSGLISVKVGVKKYTVPVDARILSDSKYVFLSIPACSELFEVKDRELHAMPPNQDATEAYALLNPNKRQGRKRITPAAIPTDVAEVLKTIPAGYKVGYDADGTPRLVRTRQRSPRKS